MCQMDKVLYTVDEVESEDEVCNIHDSHAPSAAEQMSPHLSS